MLNYDDIEYDDLIMYLGTLYQVDDVNTEDKGREYLLIHEVSDVNCILKKIYLRDGGIRGIFKCQDIAYNY